MARTIFIGDIHGCFDELVALLDRIGVNASDRVIALGDVTRKGPAPDRCVALLRDRGYESVLGNNDAKLLHRAASWRPRWIAARPDRAVLRQEDLLREVGSWPLFIDCSEIEAVAIHGGVLPNAKRFSDALVPRDAALELRYIRKSADAQWRQIPKGAQRDGDPFWADEWAGDRVIVYGHTPREEVRIHRRAIGIDTGCVYGGMLSAAVFTGPGKYEIVSVNARRRYS